MVSLAAPAFYSRVTQVSSASTARAPSQCACAPGSRGTEAQPRATATAQSAARAEEAPRFRWDELGTDLSEPREQALRGLSPKLPNRCRALMPRIVSLSPRDENLGVVLAFWVKAMKPKRADWLLVLKELKAMESPLLAEVLEYALMEDSFEANVRDYTKLIQIYGKQNLLREAEEAFHAMKARGLPCDQVMLTALVDMYSKAGDLARAKERFEEIVLLGLPLDKRAYGSMIMAYIRADMLDQAEDLIKVTEDQQIFAGKEVYKALLRAYSYKGAHGLRPVQMEALRAMCGALIPSLQPEEEEALDGRVDPPCGNKDLERFYLASGADSTVPDEVAELASRCVWEGVVLVNVTLWLLCTRLGTLALCGWLCLSGEFPYVRRFADMPVERREEALKGWTRARWLIPVKIAFAIVKIICLNVFYTTLTKNSENPCWKAIGYSVPDVEEQRRESRTEASTRRSLDNGVVQTRELDHASLLRSLADKGLAVKPTASGSHHTLECDVVIVGSGCGGGVAAAVLASAGYKVVVVEKGDYFTAEDYSSVEGPSMERLYEQGGIFCTTNVTTVLYAGATVGGGSAVNWSASIRTPREILQEWSREHGLPVFASTAYGQAMDAVCARLAVTDACREEGFQNKVVRRGCEALGLPVDAVPRNSSEEHHCGSCFLGCPTGDMRGTDTTWLVDAVQHGAVILAGCKAERFILESSGGSKNGRSKKCVGLVATCVSNSGIPTKLRIEAKVSISACGALMTPPLLRNSGLRNRHVGRNLHLHPVSMAWGYFPDTNHITGKCYEGGIITSMHRVTDRTIIETPALGPGAFASLVPWESGRDMKERMRRYARTAHAFALVRDRAAGTVDGEGRVHFTPSRDDTEELRKGLRRALRILVAAGAAEVGTHRSDGLRLRCKGVQEKDLEAFLDEVTVPRGPLQAGTDTWALLCSAHQMGSCRMGASPKDGAVDGRGESWEAEGLYVCDGSLLPTAVGVNPMITIQSLAYCLSVDIAESLAQTKKHS